MSGAAPSQEGWNLDEFVIAVGIILFSALLMYALAYTLLLNPLERNRRQLRQFQFYTGDAQTRTALAAYNRSTLAAAAAEEALEDAPAMGDTDSTLTEHSPEDAEGKLQGDDGDEGHQDSDVASMVRRLRTQRRQIETLEAVNDQLCAENERLEAKIAAISQIVT